jgi:hypothetical protein
VALMVVRGRAVGGRRAFLLVAVLLLLALAPASRAASAWPPQTAYFPQGWTTASTIVGAYVSDSGSGIDPSESYVEVDGTRRVTEFNGSNGLLYAPVSGLAPGLHGAAVVPVDNAGNAGRFEWSFSVDDGLPTLVNPTPTGEVSSRTPELTINATDDRSGVDAQSIVLTLSNGLLVTRLRAVFDPQSGVIRYQVPTIPTGIGTGQSPLLDGRYTATVTVADVAGNQSTRAWTFVVRTLL